MDDQYTDNPLAIYRREVILACPPFAIGEEDDLIARLGEPGQDAELARERLVEGYLAAVIDIAERHPNAKVHTLDLILAGNNALLAAVNAFSASGEASFSNYAVRQIESAVADASQ